jgi:hypothetical protein
MNKPFSGIFDPSMPTDNASPYERCPTVVIVGPDGGALYVNASDFDPKTMVRFDGELDATAPTGKWVF